jgi:hypothetical protein
MLNNSGKLPHVLRSTRDERVNRRQRPGNEAAGKPEVPAAKGRSAAWGVLARLRAVPPPAAERGAWDMAARVSVAGAGHENDTGGDAAGNGRPIAQQALDALKVGWGSHYDFRYTGMYEAVPVDGHGGTLKALLPDELASQLARELRQA